MWLREELLKSIWHAFTALDVDHRGKVSKSQLKVRVRTVSLFPVTTSLSSGNYFVSNWVKSKAGETVDRQRTGVLQASFA